MAKLRRRGHGQQEQVKLANGQAIATQLLNFSLSVVCHGFWFFGLLLQVIIAQVGFSTQLQLVYNFKS